MERIKPSGLAEPRYALRDSGFSGAIGAAAMVPATNMSRRVGAVRQHAHRVPRGLARRGFVPARQRPRSTDRGLLHDAQTYGREAQHYARETQAYATADICEMAGLFSGLQPHLE